MKFKINFWFLLGCFFCVSAQAVTTDNRTVQLQPYDVQVFNQTIDALYKAAPPHNLKTRTAFISHYFSGKPYLLGALGEGPEGRFDQNPLYRTDAFDCMTYVSTVLALAKSNSLAEFIAMQKKIQYSNAIVDYRQRHHFTNLDWNASNSKLGFIREVTTQFKDKNGKKVAVLSKTWIDKKNWYAQKKMDSLKFLINPGAVEAQKKLKQLQDESRYVKDEFSYLYYIPLSAMFDKNGNPRQEIFNQIPDASVIEIVRPNWDLRKEIGTRLDISHLGFAFKTPTGVIFRHASNTTHQVTELKLSDYLQEYLASPTVKGISVYEIVG